ncbi:hypothetical protein ABZW96_35890 [Nocardia sp. NPDC004168]|uniref:hypothetical protein n=1 Tax=Nocardia sp. NPDC004168 TaxID=3154452 RepID=UPI0033BD1537
MQPTDRADGSIDKPFLDTLGWQADQRLYAHLTTSVLPLNSADVDILLDKHGATRARDYAAERASKRDPAAGHQDRQPPAHRVPSHST